MAHRLLTRQPQRLETRLRLPPIQHPGEQIANQLLQSMAPQDSLRTARTTAGQSRKAIGPLAPVQAFVSAAAGGPTSPENMRSGLRIANARRLADKTRGQSAGL